MRGRQAPLLERRIRKAEAALYARYGIAVAESFAEMGSSGLRLRVLSAGAGPDLVLLHGSGLTSASWAPLLPWLGGFRVRMVDLPGHGLSGPVRYRRGQARQAESAASVAALHRALDRFRVPAPETILTGSELAQVSVPTLFLWGRDDPYLAPAGARPWAAKIPGSVLLEVRGGHAPWLDDPAGCARPVTDFLRSCGTPEKPADAQS